MKKIGEGWQYSAYDLDNGRVLKKYHSWLRNYWIILKTIFPFKNESFFIIPTYIKDMKRKAVKSFGIIRERKIPYELIANPKFREGLDFEQDKVKPLHEALENISANEGKKVIDDFIIFNKNLLNNFGTIDKSFNITKNYGLNNSNEIVLTDIGELTDNPAKIKRQIDNKIWTKHYVAGCISNKDLRNYFIEGMNKNFN